MAKRYIIDRQQNFSIPFVFVMRSLKSNIGVETVTVNSGYTLSTETKGGGFANEYTDYIFSGTTTFNKTTSIATLKIEAESDKFISKSPFLKSKFGNINLLLKKVGKSSSTIKSRQTKRNNTYTFDIVYKGIEKTTRSSGLIAELSYSSKATNFRDSIIDKVVHGFGNNMVVPQSGITRPIKIHGEPGSSFGISVVENILNRELDVDKATELSTYVHNKFDDVSILSGAASNSTANVNGKEITIIKDTIGDTGLYSFNQTYPSLIMKSKLSSAVSSSTTITLDNAIDDIKVGDVVVFEGSRINKRLFVVGDQAGIHKVVAIPSVDNRQIRINSTVTFADKTPVSIMRRRAFSIDILPDLTSTLGSKIPTPPSFTLNQYTDIKVSFQFTPGSSAFTITHFNLDIGTDSTDAYKVATGDSAGDVWSFDYILPAMEKVLRPIDLRLTLLASGGNAFTTVRNPVFNQVPYTGRATPSAASTDGSSDWTNSNAVDNGGVTIRSITPYHKLSTASVTDDTCTFIFSLPVLTTGNQDVTFNLDMSKIITVA